MRCGPLGHAADARLLVGHGESRAELLEIASERTELLIRHLLESYHPGPGSLDGANELVELELHRPGARFCAFWMMKTMRNVTIVVPVLMTSCHVSEKP